MCSCSIVLAALLVVEEHHVANADVEEVLRLYLPATAGRDMGPTCEHVKQFKGKILKQTISSSLGRCVCVNMD